MSLMRRDSYDPFDAMDRMMDRMRDVMSRSLAPFDRELVQRTDAHIVSVDMTSDDKGITVRAALPGFKQEEIDVDIQGNVLTITAESKTERDDPQENWHIREMRYGKFARSIILPDAVTVDKADATLDDGILTVRLPKETPGPIQTIAVKARNLLKSGKKM